MEKNRKIKLKGYIAIAKFRDVDYYLTGDKGVDEVTKLKISDIHTFPYELHMSAWPMMEQIYRNAKITITIDLS
mgnify:CR=1 FL=1